MRKKRALHCWAGKTDGLEFGSEEWVRAFDEPSGTCMLERGHNGPHEFTPDDQILVRFK